MEDKMIVAVFDSERKAYAGLKALNDMETEGSITLYASAVIAKDADGELTVKQTADEGPLGTGVGLFTGSLLGLLGGPAGVAVGALAGKAPLEVRRKADRLDDPLDHDGRGFGRRARGESGGRFEELREQARRSRAEASAVDQPPRRGQQGHTAGARLGHVVTAQRSLQATTDLGHPGPLGPKPVGLEPIVAPLPCRDRVFDRFLKFCEAEGKEGEDFPGLAVGHLRMLRGGTQRLGHAREDPVAAGGPALGMDDPPHPTRPPWHEARIIFADRAAPAPMLQCLTRLAGTIGGRGAWEETP